MVTKNTSYKGRPTTLSKDDSVSSTSSSDSESCDSNSESGTCVNASKFVIGNSSTDTEEVFVLKRNPARKGKRISKPPNVKSLKKRVAPKRPIILTPPPQSNEKVSWFV